MASRVAVTELTHACPPAGGFLMPCCALTPFEVSRWDRITLDLSLVTCGRQNERVTAYSTLASIDAALEGWEHGPDEEIVEITPLGADLRTQHAAAMILSRQAGHRFAGYLAAQRTGLLSHAGKGRDVTRPELVKAYGWDTKYGAHMVRLGVQGVELLETGRITLPMPQPWLTWIRDLRTGGHTMEEALDAAAGLEDRIRTLLSSYQRAWAAQDAESANLGTLG
jgi:hypothetical protein